MRNLKSKLLWALPALAALPASAVNLWPMAHFARLADKSGTVRDLNPTLSVHMKTGAAGAVGLFFKVPEFDRHGHPTSNPDVILSDLSKPMPLPFKDGNVWVLFYPTPKSEMTVLLHAQVAGQGKKVGAFEIVTTPKGEAHVQTYQFDPDFITYDKGAFMDQLMVGKLKQLPLTVTF